MQLIAKNSAKMNLMVRPGDAVSGTVLKYLKDGGIIIQVNHNFSVKNNFDLSINRYQEIKLEALEIYKPNEIINGKFNKKGELIYKGIKQLDAERKKLISELEGLIK